MLSSGRRVATDEIKTIVSPRNLGKDSVCNEIVNATSACDALTRALKPLLPDSDDVQKSPLSDPKTPKEVRRLAITASSTALPSESVEVLECILGLTESCIGVAHALTVQDPSSSLLIRYAIGLMEAVGVLVLSQISTRQLFLMDILLRLQDIVVACAQLAESEFDAGSNSKDVQCMERISDLWLWDVLEDLTEGNSQNKAPAYQLVRGAVEVTAATLASAWRHQRQGVQSAFAPLAIAAGEEQILSLILSRLVAITEGDPELADLTMTFFTDILPGFVASDAHTKNVEVYAVTIHAMAAIGAVSAVADQKKVYSRVVDLLVKLYKYPKFGISKALLYGSDVSPAERISIVGRCSGALAAALLYMASGVGNAKKFYRNDLRVRMLTLFSDFALLLPNNSYVMDLGALLPALGCVSVDVSDLTPAPSGAIENHALAEANSLNHNHSHRHRTSRASTASTLDMTLEALLQLQDRDLEIRRLHRNLWLYCGIYDFGGFRESMTWPKNWQSALGRIAVATPLLMLGAEEQKTEVLVEKLRAEYSARLLKLGSIASETQLSLLLGTLLLGGAGKTLGILPEAMGAHVLSVSYKALCMATFSAFESCSQLDSTCPLSPPLLYLSLSMPDHPEYPYLKRVTQKAFELYTERMSFRSDVASSDLDAMQEAAEQLAAVLAGALVASGRNTDVPTIADRFLDRLLGKFPSLRYKPSVLGAMLEAIFEEEIRSTRDESSAKPARLWMLRVVAQAAEAAPNATEAALVEHVRKLTAARGPESDIVAHYAPDIFQAIKASRAKSRMHYLDGTMKGLPVWGNKLHFVGRVAGMTDIQGLSGTVACKKCAAQLLGALATEAPERVASDCQFLAAAALVQIPNTPAADDLLKLICWAAAKQFNPGFVDAAALTWHWVWAASQPSTQLMLIAHLVDAWLGTKSKKQGIFQVMQPRQNPLGFQLRKLAQELKCHHVWIRFFIEILQSFQGDISSAKVHGTHDFERLLTESLSDVEALCIHPAAAGAYFRLLHLGLSYSEQTGSSKVYELTIQAAFHWFASPPGCHENSTAMLFETANALRDFSAAAKKASWPDQDQHKLALLHHLLKTEVYRLAVWASPLQASQQGGSGLSNEAWRKLVKTAWSVSPRLAIALQYRFGFIKSVSMQLQSLTLQNAQNPELHHLPDAVPLLANEKAIASDAPELQQLYNWELLPLSQAIAVISGSAGRHHSVREYLMRCFSASNPDQVAFYLPQLVQALRQDFDKAVEEFLLEAASRSVYFAYLLVCQLTTEGTPPEEAFNPTVKRSNWSPPKDTGLWKIADRVKQRLMSDLHGPIRELLMAEIEYFEAVTDVSGKLYPVPKEERKSAAVRFVEEISTPSREDLFLPTNVNARIIRAIPESAAPMQSAAKCPILVAFDVDVGNDSLKNGGPAVQACIFKVGDDCRQDVLALQVIELLKREFEAAHLDLKLFPYGVVPTGHECGIIQVVPNAKSRAQLGEVTDGGLFEIFQREFGMPGSKRFEAARRNFLLSSAGYAVASYILQAKDRHNGNIMIDSKGYIIHIDFGYILGISPGGNLGFESAAFKLSYEMTELLDPGRKHSSSIFMGFEELCVKGYLAARNATEEIVATVSMMLPSELPCFSRGRPIENLRRRFHQEMSDPEAADFMRGLIRDAYDKWTTGVYDVIQYYQNAIPK